MRLMMHLIQVIFHPIFNQERIGYKPHIMNYIVHVMLRYPKGIQRNYCKPAPYLPFVLHCLQIFHMKWEKQKLFWKSTNLVEIVQSVVN